MGTDAPDGRPALDAASERPGDRTRLSRERILAAALRLVDSEGLDALTMRRLGQELRRDPMALYRYLPNRTALLDGVAERVLDEFVIATEGEDWQGELRRSAHNFRQLALAHRHVAPLLVTRPLSTPLGLRPPGALRPLEQVLTLLTRAGFAPDDALHVYRAYFGFLYGHIINELQELVADPEETDDLLRLGLHRLPAKEFPQLRSLASAFGSYDGAAELDHGLDILLAGLQTQLHA
jgi:AcrR family transcriptional regulator